MAHSLLPLAEKQRRVLRNLRRLEGLGLVSASDGYQGLVDELAKVTTLCACYVHAQVHLCTCTGGVTVLAFQGQALLSSECHLKLSPAKGKLKVLFEGHILKSVVEGDFFKLFY
jgi:hypothetical protein